MGTTGVKPAVEILLLKLMVIVLLSLLHCWLIELIVWLTATLLTRMVKLFLLSIILETNLEHILLFISSYLKFKTLGEGEEISAKFNFVLNPPKLSRATCRVKKTE